MKRMIRLTVVVWCLVTAISAKPSNFVEWGSIKEDLTNVVLVEGENFSGELSGSRYGTLQHWITENYKQGE